MTVYEEYKEGHKARESLQQLARTHTHECGGLLSVRYWQDSWSLRCGKCGPLNEGAQLTRIKSLTRRYQDGETLNPAIKNKIEAKEDKELTQEIGAD